MIFFIKKKIFSFLKNKKLNNFNLVLDVGAHKGETINIFLKNFKIKKIISFEASPKNFLKLKNNLKNLSKKFQNSEIIIENIALSNEKKKIQFKQFAESSSSTIRDINQNSKYFHLLPIIQIPIGLIVPKTPGHIFFKILGFPV